MYFFMCAILRHIQQQYSKLQHRVHCSLFQPLTTALSRVDRHSMTFDPLQQQGSKDTSGGGGGGGEVEWVLHSKLTDPLFHR